MAYNKIIINIKVKWWVRMLYVPYLKLLYFITGDKKLVMRKFESFYIKAITIKVGK